MLIVFDSYLSIISSSFYGDITTSHPLKFCLFFSLIGSELNTERETLKRERKLSTEKIAQLEEELKAARIDCTNKGSGSN